MSGSIKASQNAWIVNGHLYLRHFNVAPSPFEISFSYSLLICVKYFFVKCSDFFMYSKKGGRTKVDVSWGIYFIFIILTITFMGRYVHLDKSFDLNMCLCIGYYANGIDKRFCN